MPSTPAAPPTPASPDFTALTKQFEKARQQFANSGKLLSEIKEEEVRIAQTPKSKVFGIDKVSLHRYQPVTETRLHPPVLIAYGLVGRYTMIDLQDDRSLVRNLLAQGVDVYVVDWGNPNRADRWISMDDYIGEYIDACVDHICAAAGVDSINVLGICEGGTFSLCYAALKPEKVRNLILTITPVDFHADQDDGRRDHGFVNLWLRNVEASHVERVIDSFGHVPGKLMGQIFSNLTPVRSMTKYNLDMLATLESEDKLRNFLRMEQWLADRPNHTGEAARQFFVDLYQQNRLVKGEFQLCGRKVDLGEVSMPVLNIYAREDHIVPPPTTRALGKYVGSPDYSELELPGGHVGMFVSSKAQGLVGKTMVDWLTQRQ